MKEFLQTWSKMLHPRKKMLATFAALLCMMALMPMTARAETINTVISSEELTKSSTVYVGEVVVDGVSEIKFLYSGDITLNNTLLQNLLDGLNGMADGDYAALLEEYKVNAYFYLPEERLALCSNPDLVAAMDANWSSALYVGTLYYADKSVVSEINSNLYDLDAGFKAVLDAKTAQRIEDIENIINEPKSFVTHLGASSNENVWYEVVESVIVKHVDTYITYNSEATTVIYTKVELETPMTETPLTFEAVEAGTINIINPNGLTIEYNKNNTGWTSSSADPISIAVAANDVVAFRGNNSCYWASGDSGETPTRFTATNPCYVYGNVMSLVHDNDFATNYTLNDSEALAYLFAAPTDEEFKFYGNNTTLQNHPSKDIVLPASAVPDDGYMYMFAGCQGLTRAPQLPATTIGMGSYHQMFADCIGLVTVPEELPATTLSMSCYDNMFFGCTSIEVAPSLPATTLANGCYMGMFTGCTSLTTAPALPATTLAEDCYHRMFEGCTSLTKAPDLPAATLFGQVYGGMFDGCTSLNYVKCLATDLGENVGVYASVADWLNNVSPTGTFVKHPDMANWPTGTIDGIPSGWTVEDDMYSLPLTFESLSNTLMINLYTTMSLYGLQYRTYNASNNTWSNWSTFSSGSTNNTCYVTGVGSKIQFKRENNAPLAIGYDAYSYFKNLTGNCYVYGNVMSLYNFETVLNDTYACFKLFDNNAGIRNHPTKDLVLGATTLSNSCYMYMFRNCTGLTRIPELPVTTLTNYCYYEMFRGCTALNTTPVLPATTLANYCYYGMFRECSSLTTPPELPVTTLANNCYCCMFCDCTNLQSAPVLPATIMAESCYGAMFAGCTSLQTAPELPATTLAADCYNEMFNGCTGLTIAPELPATVMVHKCYYDMFGYCTNLQTAPALPSTSMAYWCYNKMFEYCTSLTTAPVLPATTLAQGCYIWMFFGCSNLNYVKCLATDISADNCTLNWLTNVSPTGTFVKAAGMEDWEIGVNPDDGEHYGIPEGWLVESIDVFTTDGDWDVAANWSGNAVPADGSDVAIVANATIPSGITVHADDIDLYGTLTIADGGQLYHNNEGVTATVQKNIMPYTIEQTSGEEKSNGWYLLASPMQEAVTPSETMFSNRYDLYRFNQSVELEGENYLQHSNFMLNNGQGYLYANGGDGEHPSVMIDIEGQLQPSDEDVEVPLAYDASAEFAGFNLVGNPFACNAYLSEPHDFYVMNAARNELEISENEVIAPLQGLFVQAANANDNAVTFTRTQPETQGKGGALTLNVYEGSALRLLRQAQEPAQGPQPVIDRARVRFGEGPTLNKFSLKPNGTKLFIPQGLQDYAVVYAEKQGEMPVNFKAAENGRYTLSVNPENAEMSYLHLIDNLTGADVDLLQTPEYTFEAKTSDYASRFRLVFSANETDDPSTASETFAFINNSNIIITNAEAGAMLQILDVTGRVIRCSDAMNCVSTNEMTSGVYVLRLINGDSVKTQKIVVR